jgi:hypothetical protein
MAPLWDNDDAETHTYELRLLQARGVRLKQYAAVLAVAKSAVQTSGEQRLRQDPQQLW